MTISYTILALTFWLEVALLAARLGSFAPSPRQHQVRP